MALERFNINGVLSKYTGLVVDFTQKSEVLLKGFVDFDIIHCDTRIIDSYEIEINISDSYPIKIPVVKEVGSRILSKFEHIYSDRSLCLATEADIHIELNPNYDLLDFIEKFVISYLFSYSFFEKYKVFPFGERSHGLDGIVEFYEDYFNVESYSKVLKLLEYTCNKIYRGHDLCPCGSGKRIRDCHKKSVLNLIDKNVGHVLKNELDQMKKG